MRAFLTSAGIYSSTSIMIIALRGSLIVFQNEHNCYQTVSVAMGM